MGDKAAHIFDLPFKVHTNASNYDLGAVLYQNQDGANRVIAYAYHNLKPSEKKPSVHKLEFLALQWC